MRSSAIYVEIPIQATVDYLWGLTQDTSKHQRWDGRFTQITEVDTGDLGAPTRFRYGIRIAPGVWIRGHGENTGNRHSPTGAAVSALKFWSDERLSLIRSGTGYWRYVAETDTVTRFITKYDYEVRWGRLGKIADYVWRPLMGRLTAWSFDRLRLWAERGLSPSVTRLTTLCSVSFAISGAVALLTQSPRLALVASAGWAAMGPITPKARRCARRRTLAATPSTANHAAAR